MGEDFVLDDGGVVVDEDEFDGERGDFGDEDAAEGISEGGVDADEGERGVEGCIFMEVDVEVLSGKRVSLMDDWGIGKIRWNEKFLHTSENFFKLHECSSPG